MTCWAAGMWEEQISAWIPMTFGSTLSWRETKEWKSSGEEHGRREKQRWRRRQGGTWQVGGVCVISPLNYSLIFKFNLCQPPWQRSGWGVKVNTRGLLPHGGQTTACTVVGPFPVPLSIQQTSSLNYYSTEKTMMARKHFLKIISLTAW